MIRAARTSSAQSVTYSSYCTALSCVDQYDVRAFSLPPVLQGFIASLREFLQPVAEELGASIKELAAALATRNMFRFLRGLRFSLAGLLRGMHALSALLPRGLNAMFSNLQHTELYRKFQNGVAVVDDFLNEYPILKKLAGPALAAFLFWMWLNVSFVGNPTTDFDLSNIGRALVGQYTLREFLASPEALTSFLLLATGAFGVSVPWLGKTAYNLTLAIVFTALKQARDHGLARKARALLQPRRMGK